MQFFSSIFGGHPSDGEHSEKLISPSPSGSISDSNTSSFLSAHSHVVVHTTTNPYHSVPAGEDDKSMMMADYTLAPHIHHSHMTKAAIPGIKESSIPACYFTLANTIMGAGTLGLPFAVSNTGYVLGSILLCLSAMSSSFALHLLTLCALKLPYPSSFYKVAETAMPHFEKLIDLAVMIKCFGVATSYLIVIGGLMPDVMSDIFGDSSNSPARSFFESRLTWVTAGFFVVVPLSFFQQLGALRYTSFMSLSFLFFLTLMVVLFASNIGGLDPCAKDDDSSSTFVRFVNGEMVDSTGIVAAGSNVARYLLDLASTAANAVGVGGSSNNDGECVGERVNIQFNLNTMKVFSIFIFGFTCHQNMFTIVNELHAVTLGRCNQVIFYAIGTALSVYLVIANCGYSTYGDNVESNILASYPKVNIVSVARCFVSLLVCFTYPLQCNPARRCVMTLLASIFKDSEKPAASLEHVINIRYIAVTVIFLGASYAIALSVSDLGVMLSLVGATGSTLVSYILPGFCYFFLFRNEGPAWKRNLALLQGCVGLVLIPICLTFIFLE